MAARYSGPGLAYEGLAEMTPSGPRWTGKLMVVDKHMDDPIRWQKPRRVFVNSMSDLFHEDLEDRHIRQIFEVMLQAPRHTYQILTKRHLIMNEFVKEWLDDACWPQSGCPVGDKVPGHIWLGVSVEDQKAADLRIYPLLDTPATVRFLSVEPMIGPVDIRPFLKDGHDCGIHWVIIGGESGNGARPMQEAWVRDLVEQCKGARVAIFVKQMGTVWAKENEGSSYKGENMSEWPKDLRIQEYPEVAA